mmetsp:Transcript_14465/g.24291  ORF Transcript_14465/g.24291 Transcript_14465/m.24291 type:complete len:233 (+) Transcript_14465:53-751(+)
MTPKTGHLISFFLLFLIFIMVIVGFAGDQPNDAAWGYAMIKSGDFKSTSKFGLQKFETKTSSGSVDSTVSGKYTNKDQCPSSLNYCEDCGQAGKDILGLLSFTLVMLLVGAAVVGLRLMYGGDGILGENKRYVSVGIFCFISLLLWACLGVWSDRCQSKINKAVHDSVNGSPNVTYVTAIFAGAGATIVGAILALCVGGLQYKIMDEGVAGNYGGLVDPVAGASAPPVEPEG